MNGIITLQQVKELYAELDSRECGDSYFTKWDGTKVSIDTGYAFGGIELFIEELEHRLQAKEENMKFKENELVIYAPKDANGQIYKFQIGKFKRYNSDFTHGYVYYHAGSTAASTDIKDLYHLEGKEYIKDEFNSLDQKESE